MATPNVGPIGHGSSATQYLAQTGLIEAKRIWREYPVPDYGKDWDEPAM
jgi:hypothetical protein